MPGAPRTTFPKCLLLLGLCVVSVSSFRRAPSTFSSSISRHRPTAAEVSNPLTPSTPTHFKSRPYACDRLNALNPSLSASFGLLSAATIGNHVDHLVDSTGILATLAVSALLGNLNLVPSTHVFYDLCWTLFLPASLAFLLLGSGDEPKQAKTKDESSTDVALMAGPFALGSIGSILGCLLARPRVSAAAAGCLCASYIGGSVNFFATARIVGAGAGAELTAMATCDLVVMAVYFALLSAIWKWNRLRNLFGTGETTAMSVDSTPTATQNPGRDNLNWKSAEQFIATILVSTLVFAIVQVSNRIERALASVVPGTACGVIALLCTLWRRLFGKLAGGNGGQQRSIYKFWKRKVQPVASNLSGICFQLLFASIGITANLGQALESGPTCLLYSLNALLMHVGVVLMGSLIWKKVVSCKTRLQHVLIASNAAIGGPATAATFAGNMGLPHLTLAATIWGVVGYAIGTSIGVQLTHFLLPR